MSVPRAAPAPGSYGGHAELRGVFQLMHYHHRQPFDDDPAGRDNPGVPAAPARWGASGAASPDLGRTHHQIA